MASINSKCNSDTSAVDVVVEMTSFVVVAPCVDGVPKFRFEREDNSWEFKSGVTWYEPGADVEISSSAEVFDVKAIGIMVEDESVLVELWRMT